MMRPSSQPPAQPESNPSGRLTISARVTGTAPASSEARVREQVEMAGVSA